MLSEKELVHTIERYYSAWMLGLYSQVGALQILKDARKRPKETTVIRIEAKSQFVLNGDFEGGERDASSGSVFIREYVTKTLVPRIVEVHRDEH